MKYTKEITDQLVDGYKRNLTISELAASLSVPERSVIAKLSSLGVYRKQQYLNKRGEVPRKKSDYILKISELLGMNVELLESLEKVNKSVLQVLEDRLSEKSQP